MVKDLHVARCLVLVVVTTLALYTSRPHAQQASRDLDEALLARTIEQALRSAPSGFHALLTPSQAGVRLLAVNVARLSRSTQRVTIDLSQKALTYAPSGNVDIVLDHVVTSTAMLTAGGGHVEYRFLVDGLPLDQFVPQMQHGRVRPLALDRGGRVVVSAGHGWYWDETSTRWLLQRDYYWGIVEDLVNWDIADHLSQALAAGGFDVRTARAPTRDGRIGASGFPEWQEAARYFIKGTGAPSTIWDLGADDYARDINSRPLYANWVDAAVVVAIHNNGGGGTGTETWFDATNGYQTESLRLADIVNSKVVAAIRASYNPNWPDRGLRSCNGCKGENRLAGRPAILVEVAFMDTKSPDNEALQDDRFKRIVAQAIHEGLQEWARTPDTGEPDIDREARRDMAARTGTDPRFGAPVEGSYGRDVNWSAEFEMRWMDFLVGTRRVRVFHLAQRTDRTVRFIGFTDPDTGVWTGWERTG